MDVNKKFEWIEEIDESSLKVKTKKGDYILKEQIDSVIEQVTRLSEKSNVSMQALLAARSIQEPKTTDSEFSELPSSVSSKLKFAAAKLNGLTDFL